MNLYYAAEIVKAIIPPDFIWLLETDGEVSTLLLMQKEGKAFARLYQWLDTPDEVYLNWLTVIESARKQGLGTRLQEIREEVGKAIHAQVANLNVLENSWMHFWYKRRGYVEILDLRDNENYIWLYKRL